MRNLKRALSLTLASVMLLGMMVVGTSAAGYDDVKETDNVEAIEVLQAIEVMVGDERGFGPERPVNRAEMAVVMGKLLNLDYNYYATSCPFNDVYDWARGYVGACYANKIVSGRGDGVYDPGATVTAVEAASMLMRALGYFQYANDVADGFELSTVREGTKIGIFDQVGSSATEPMTRNQVAQMVLNALQSAVVEPDGNTINLTTPDGTVLTGKVNYVSVTSEKSFARAIGRVGATSIGSTNDGWIVELGERLYDGKLKLTDTTDAFMRPSRHWEFDGKDVGTYMKKELLRQEWSVKVTGRMLYDVLTKPTIDDYDFTIAVDGVQTVEENKANLGGAFFTKGNLIRSNTEKVGATEKGVLTQVFVDPDNEDVYIAVINTYLAKATADYNEKKDEANFEVWHIDDRNDSSTNKFLVKDEGVKSDVNGSANYKEVLALSGEDFDVKDVKKDDIILVQVAEGEVKVVLAPEIIDETTISSFKKNNWVNANGTQYDYADTIKYDDEVLDEYDQSNMKDTTYRVYLDKYGYAIGVEIIEDAAKYAFLTGIDGNTSNLTNKTADGNLIFTDGTIATVKINMEKSKALNDNFVKGTDSAYVAFKPAALWNTWCTYTVNSDNVYTLTEVADTDAQMTSDDAGEARTGKRTVDKVGQGWDNAELAGNDSAYTTIINKSHIALNGLDKVAGHPINGTGSDLYNKVYGNDDSVYINVATKKIDRATEINPHITTEGTPNNQALIINDVDSVATGVQNVSLKAYDHATLKNMTGKNIAEGGTAGGHYSYGTYTLFDDDGFVIAAVVVGEDDGVSSKYAYAFNNDVRQEDWSSSNREWTWHKDVVIDGEETTLTEVGDGLSELKKMRMNNWYEVKFKANGNVKSVTKIETLDAAGPVAIGSSAGTHTKSNGDADNARDYIFCTNPSTHIGANANGTGNNYPKFIGKIEWVQNALEDNTSGKVVLFEDMYTGNESGNTLKYTLNTAGTSLQVENPTGGKVKGFAVSGNAKTVLVQDKRIVDASGKQIGDISRMDSREYFSGGKDGLESAIRKLNLNKNTSDKYFRGYVSAVFENGVAQTVIIYERMPNDVNWGGDDGSAESKALSFNPDTGDLKVYMSADDTSTLSNKQIYDYLASKGYTNISFDNSGSPVWSFSDDGLKYTTAINQIPMHKVTINGNTEYAATNTLLNTLLGETYNSAKHGTYAKVTSTGKSTTLPIGTYVSLSASGKVTTCDAIYEIGYFTNTGKTLEDIQEDAQDAADTNRATLIDQDKNTSDINTNLGSGNATISVNAAHTKATVTVNKGDLDTEIGDKGTTTNGANGIPDGMARAFANVVSAALAGNGIDAGDLVVCMPISFKPQAVAGATVQSCVVTCNGQEDNSAYTNGGKTKTTVYPTLGVYTWNSTNSKWVPKTGLTLGDATLEYVVTWTYEDTASGATFTVTQNFTVDKDFNA